MQDPEEYLPADTLLWCTATLAQFGIPVPLPYNQNQMWVRGDYDEWFLTSQHELSYLTLREAAANFLEHAGEDQVILRHTPHPTGAWNWQPPAAILPPDIPDLDLIADEAALEEDIITAARSDTKGQN